MIELPDFDRAFDYENGFYLSCDNTRISKFVAHYELFRRINDLPGAIVDCGVFKGSSLIRFASFRELFGIAQSRKLIGFDTFATYPATEFRDDQAMREKFISDAGDQSLSIRQLREVLERKRLERNVELVEGDIRQTVPDFVRRHSKLKIALLNLDTDIYEPATVILDHLYPCLVRGGILLIDDYGVFPGETQAVDEYFADKDVIIRKLEYCVTPCYVVKA